MPDINMDALAESYYSGSDQQYIDTDAAEKAELKEAVEQVIDDLETVIYELEAVKQNFLTLKYNRIHSALTEIKEQLYEEITE